MDDNNNGYGCDNDKNSYGDMDGKTDDDGNDYDKKTHGNIDGKNNDNGNGDDKKAHRNNNGNNNDDKRGNDNDDNKEFMPDQHCNNFSLTKILHQQNENRNNDHDNRAQKTTSYITNLEHMRPNQEEIEDESYDDGDSSIEEESTNIIK